MVVGAGPAGLSAALLLGRSRRRVLVLDSGDPRNAASAATHGVLGHDGVDPARLRATGREELARYGVVVRSGVEVSELLDTEDSITVVGDGARAVVLATGLLDDRPPLPGADELWGHSVHTCPYCDGWEHRDQRLAAYVRGDDGAHLALLLRELSDDVVLLTDGPHSFDQAALRRLHASGVAVEDRPLARLVADGTRLREVAFADGPPLPRDALFAFVGVRLRSDLGAAAGCETGRFGELVTDRDGRTTHDRVYAAGNCANPRALVATAAGEGATVAMAVHEDLIREDADRVLEDSS